jgi:hypothetical protein
MEDPPVRPLTSLCICAAAAAVLAAAPPAHALPTALINIPIADSLDKHTFLPDLMFVYNPGAPVALNSFQVDTELGLGNGWEAGYDFAPNAPHQGWFNAKKTFNDNERTRWAVGAYNIRPAALGATVPYVVASRASHDGETNYHVGTLFDGAVEGFAGIDHRLGNDVTLYTDYMMGPNGMGTLGLGFSAGDHADLVIGAMVLNGGGVKIYTDVLWSIDW